MSTAIRLVCYVIGVIVSAMIAQLYLSGMDDSDDDF